jgi:hypothetical protein
MPCPRCGAAVGDVQDWCLECGAAARTRIARTAAWRVPIWVVAGIGALCLAALAFAFIRLANTDDDVNVAKATTPASAIPAVPAQTTPPTQTSAFGPIGATGATGSTGATGPTSKKSKQAQTSG